MALLDLFGDDDDVPAPAEPPARSAPHVREAPSGKAAPTWKSHPCEVHGCPREGCYGLVGQAIGNSVWRCVQHVWPGFLPGDRR